MRRRWWERGAVAGSGLASSSSSSLAAAGITTTSRRATIGSAASAIPAPLPALLLLLQLLISLVALLARAADGYGPPALWGRPGPDDKIRCPKVKGARNFDISQFLGRWYVVQYYASSEEAVTYRCMRAELSSPAADGAEVTMNFTYSFTDDPINEQLVGNITWRVPSPELPAHWLHAEQPYEGVYNTYVLDSDYKSWALLMHCAEKSKSPRYLSSFIMSRETELGDNVVSYLREKLPRYDIDLQYMFDMDQSNCTSLEPYASSYLVPAALAAAKRKIGPAAEAGGDQQQQQQQRRHPLKRKHRRT